MTLLEVSNLSHVFPDGTCGLRNVNTTFNSGELVVIAGRNGSGKTLLMLHLNGLLEPSAGTVSYRGKPIGSCLPLVRQRIGLVFQDSDNQFIGQTVREDIAFGPENLALERECVDERVDKALAGTGILHLAGARPFVLSGGEKKKVAVAGVIAMEPEIVVLDEPFAGLDWQGVRMILTEIVRLHGSGCTVIVITHDVDKVLAHASRLLVMDSGALVLDGAPGDLISELSHLGVRTGNGRLSEMTWLA